MFKIDKKTNKILITRGDSAGFKVDLLTADDKSYQLNRSDTLKLTVRKKANSEALIEKTADSEGVFYLLTDDTSSMSVGLYVYDIELKNSDIVNTVIPISYFEICQEVSR